MAFDFRTKLTVTDRSVLGIDTDEFELSQANGITVKLSSINDGPIRGAAVLRLTGGAFPTREDAEAEGLSWIRTMAIAFAQERVGVIFGYGPGDMIRASPAGSMAVDVQTTVTAALLTSGEKLRAAVDSQLQRGLPSDNRHDLAAEFLHASFFELNGEARLIFLVTAVEAMLTIKDRSPQVAEFINTLKPIVKQSDLTERDKNAVYTALRDAKRQSITGAGVDLAETVLAGQKYGDGRFEPGAFFRRCYDVRSILVHGKRPQDEDEELPTPQEIGWLAANLEVFVSQLLIASLDQGA